MTLLHTFPSGETLWLYPPVVTPVPEPSTTPHLFITGSAIIEETNAIRMPIAPKRNLSGPILQAGDVRNFGCAVVKTETGFRLWYHVWNALGQVRNATRTSQDGLNWTPPFIIEEMGDRGLYAVLDDGVGLQRYKTVIPAVGMPPLWAGELWTSPDGIVWSKVGLITTGKWGEMWTLSQETVLLRYNMPRPTSHSPFWRTVYQTPRTATLPYPTPTAVFIPPIGPTEEKQYYNVSNVIQRGSTRIAALAILRDDLVASGAEVTPENTPFGTGYTALMWSQNGGPWQQSGTYFSPDVEGSWDHAIAWISAILPMGSETWLYYGGYKQGHKTYSDRAIGRLVIPRDRYVAYIAGSTERFLRTKPFPWSGKVLTLNAKGKVEISILYAGTNNVIPGYTTIVDGDGLDLPCLFPSPLESLNGQSVKLKFTMTNAELYAYGVAP